MLVRSVGLSQPLEFSGFSVDASAFVDSPVERGPPDWTLSNSREYLLTGIAARRFRDHQTAGRPPSGNRCGCRATRTGKHDDAPANWTRRPLHRFRSPARRGRMEFRDQQTHDAIAGAATLLATAYQRFRRARRIEIPAEDVPNAVNGELDNGCPESLHGHEVDA